MCAHSCTCLGKDKSQKVSVCVFSFFRHILRLIWFWLGSHQSSGKALSAKPWKTIKDIWLRRGQNRLQPTAKHRHVSDQLHTLDLYAFQLPHKPFPYRVCMLSHTTYPHLNDLRCFWECLLAWQKTDVGFQYIFSPAGTFCQSSETQAEIPRPRGVLTSKEEASSPQPGCPSSLYSALTDTQGQNKADHAVLLPRGLLHRQQENRQFSKRGTLGREAISAQCISLHLHLSLW